MKFLYVAPEHVSGTLSLFKREHERRGDHCRFVTFWHSRWNFPDDICLNLSGMPDRGWVRGVRHLVSHDPHDVPSRIKNDMLPVWNPPWLVRAMFALRDEWNWRKIRQVIAEHRLADVDVLHLDGGADFTRDARFAAKLRSQGAHVVAYYHGSDLRSRGFIPKVDSLTELRLTPEWDLLALDNRLHYLYLPFDEQRFPVKKFAPGRVLHVGHAARNPLKGTATVCKVLERLRKSLDVELVLIKDLSHEEARRAIASCDVFIDQLSNRGGWGYGMSSVEALALGLPVVTNIPQAMLPYVGVHPFVQADEQSLEEVLRTLLPDRDRLGALSELGTQWVRERHDVQRVGDVLYGHYERLGWLR